MIDIETSDQRQDADDVILRLRLKHLRKQKKINY